MGAPKSVTKVVVKQGKTNITFTNECDKASYFIYELTRGALRDVGKFVKNTFKADYYSHFKRHTGNAGKATSVKVIAGKSTTAPRVQIGLKTGKVDGFYAYFQEFGSSKTPRLGLLQNAVKNNVAEIVKIESQYLSALSGEASRLESLIDEKEFNDED